MLALIREIGAFAGWAAGVGLVVLSALYLVQARDLKRLREWAGRAPERSRPAPAAVRRRAPITRIRARSGAVALVGLLVFGAAAFGVTRLTAGDGRDGSRTVQANRADGSRDKPKRAPIDPGTFTVAVLNGTTVPGLAAMLRDQIAAAGFRTGTIDVFSDQQLAESVVQYAPGHQAEAKAVGRTVGISRREPITPTGRALGGDATVTVIAGADKAP